MIRWLPVFLVVCATSASMATECIQIFYDRVEQVVPRYTFGRVHATLLQNLLGHFPKYQQRVAPIEKYQKGDFDLCKVNFYLGTYYDNPLPVSFRSDLEATTRTLVWMGYNAWQLESDVLEKSFGVRFLGLSILDEKKDPEGFPGFFRFYDYLGERFEKYAGWDSADPKKLNAAYEIALYEPLGPQVEAIAMASHSTQNISTPYVLRKGNRWLVAESPFSFATESDRYLIMADLLFDILGEKPRHEKKVALFRLEDLHPRVPPWQIHRMVDLFKSEGIPFSATLVPVFRDPLKITTSDPLETFVPLTQAPLFLSALHRAKESGASFFLHGVTHQYGETPNPFSAITGDDFEFWDRVRNRPIGEDSPEYVTRRLSEGWGLVDRAGIQPIGWVTPHYQASALDSILFGQLFEWSAGRVIYFPFHAAQKKRLPSSMRLGSVASISDQLKFLSDLRVTTHEDRPNGQFFPYEIFGDVFGQRIIPENIGNLQPFMNEQVFKAQTVPDMVRMMRRNRKLRDVWGSFFIHPFLLEETSEAGAGKFTGDVEPIRRLIRGAKTNGYQFVDLKSWIENQSQVPNRPDPIEID